MKVKKLVITGGPSTGKTTLINALALKNYNCLEEVSRAIIQEAQQQGIAQLFLEAPLRFSERLLEERLLQYNTAINSTSKYVFLDRGIPDILAYMDYTKTAYPAAFCKAAASTPYDMVFLLEPWQAIHTTDGERYESFEQAQDIHKCILNTYKTYNYTPITVPFGTVEERVTFITNTLAQ